jgi:DNA polymerase
MTPPTLKQQMLNCRLCPDLACSRNNVVIGEGPVPCDLIFLGEAPGEKEDATGRPFCGASGTHLRMTAERVELKKGMYHILNALKCRPPENRKPTATELSNCRGYLLKQIHAVKPKLIVALGCFAHAAATGVPPTQVRVTKNAGKLVTFGDLDIPCILTYHPAFILRMRNTEIDRAFVRHLRRAKKMVYDVL